MTKIKIYITLSICVIALIVFGLKPLIKWQLESGLSDYLKLEVSIGTIDLNPLDGKYRIEGLAIGENLTLSDLSVGIKLLPLFDQSIQVHHVRLDGLKTAIIKSNETIMVGDYEIPAQSATPAASESPPWTYQIEKINISNTRTQLSIDGQEHMLKIKNLELGNISTDLASPVDISLEIQLDDASLSSHGKYQYSDSASQSFAGEINITDLKPEKFEQLLQQPIAGNFTTRQTVKFTGQPESFELFLDGSTKLVGLKLKTEATQEQASIDLNMGELSLNQRLTIARSAESLQVTSEGDLTLVELEYNQRTLGRLNWAGVVAFDQPAEQQPAQEAFALKANGDLAVSALTDPVFGELMSANMVAISLSSGESLTAQALLIKGINTSLSRSEDGTIPGLSGGETNSQVNNQANNQTKNSNQTNPDNSLVPIDEIRIERFEVTDSRIRFTDHKVTPVTTFELNDLNFTLTPFSIVADQTFTFSAKHQADESRVGLIESHGTINPANQISGKAALKLQNLELHEVGAYLGGGVQSGRLTLSTDIDIDKGLVKLNNNIMIEAMKLTKSGSAQQSGSAEPPASGVSAALALYLLKDKKGNIELKVPVETDLENFSIGTQDIIAKALSGAAQKAALNYAKFILQPYGSLLLLKDIAGEIAKPRFEPVKFEPRSIILSDDGAAYVMKIAELLANKPEMRVTICGVSTLLDLPVAISEPAQVESQLPETGLPESKLIIPEDSYFLALAKQRGDITRETIQKQGIEGTRIFSCQAIIEKKESAPRVEISL